MVSGKLHNDSSKTIETVTLAVKFQEAKGNVVAEENIALPIPALKPQDTREFSVRVSNNAPPVTQALVRFETAKGGDRLSSDVALLLVVGLDQDQ
ncbi:MAG TPA: FxLYD domain-containing protein [Pyrinomonadaceae bacterium]|nr:FxLYD domain-containing protein [Pyrinomonadaceae bacterium]